MHYRDIRQSSLSLVHHSGTYEVGRNSPTCKALEHARRLRTETQYFEGVYRAKFQEWLPFLEDWAECIAKDARFEFLITNFDDLSEETNFVDRIMKFYDVQRNEFDWTILNSPKEERAAQHFRKGLKG